MFEWPIKELAWVLLARALVFWMMSRGMRFIGVSGIIFWPEETLVLICLSDLLTRPLDAKAEGSGLTVRLNAFEEVNEES